jgi:hypothetical protein
MGAKNRHLGQSTKSRVLPEVQRRINQVFFFKNTDFAGYFTCTIKLFLRLRYFGEENDPVL